MGKYKYYGGCFLMACIIVSGCENPIKEKLTFIKKWRITYEDSLAPKSTFKSDAAEGFLYNKVDEKNIFGKGQVYDLPDSLINKDIRLCIEGFVRVGKFNSGNVIAISLQKGDSVFYWKSLNTDDYLKDVNTWEYFSDSTQLPGWINSVKGARVAVYGFKSGTQSYMDLDDLKITLKQVDFVKR